MECRCGKRISRYMKGTCMTCRYNAMLQKKSAGTCSGQEKAKKKPRIIVNVSELQKPYLPPTLPVKIGEVVPDHEVAKHNSFFSDFSCEGNEEHRRRGRENNALTRPYTEAEDEKILRMDAEGMTCTQIAAQLNRRPAGVRQRINKLKKREKEKE